MEVCRDGRTCKLVLASRRRSLPLARSPGVLLPVSSNVQGAPEAGPAWDPGAQHLLRALLRGCAGLGDGLRESC